LRKINVLLTDTELKSREESEKRKGEKAYKPKNRNRVIPASLKAYALLVSSADIGAVRMI
jgi:dihydroxy-acid dehydratase